MGNTVFDNRVISSKATDLLLTMINHKNFMTIDTDLQGTEGMLKTINTYTYTGEAEVLAQGVGCTAAKRGSVSYVGKDYRIQCIQQAFDYFDEEFMKDRNVVDVATKGSTEQMTNFLTNKFYEAIEEKNAGSYLIGATPFANGSKIDYDAVVDAIADMNMEDESKLFLVIPNKWKADIRKDSDFKSCLQGEIIHNGQIGNISGIPVIATKRLTDRAYLLTKEAVTMFIKKNIEVEQERDSDKRANAVYLREYYVCAITDATKARMLGEAQNKEATITTYTAAAKTIAGQATTGAKVKAYVNGVLTGSEVTASSNAYSITATDNLVAGDVVKVVAVKDGFIDSTAVVTVA